MASIPLTFCLPNWFTSHFVAAKMGKDITTVQKWCRSGLLTSRGYTVAIIRDTRGKRYWIRIDTMRRDGMLRKVLLDTLPTPTIGSKS